MIMLIPEVQRLYPIACEPFARPRDYEGLAAATLGIAGSGIVAFGPFQRAAGVGETVVLAATDIETRGGRVFGRLCSGKAAGTTVQVPSAWGWKLKKWIAQDVRLPAPQVQYHCSVVNAFKSVSSWDWVGLRFIIREHGVVSRVWIGDVAQTYYHANLAVDGHLVAEVTAQTDSSTTIKIYGSGSVPLIGLPFSTPPRTIVLPKGQDLVAKAEGPGQGCIVSVTAQTWIEQRQPKSWTDELAAQPFPIAVRNLQYLDATALLDSGGDTAGSPWWGAVDSIARAGAWVTRLAWPEGKAVRFTRHIGSANAIAVVRYTATSPGTVVTTKDFTAADFNANDWLAVPSASGEESYAKYPLLDITDMPVTSHKGEVFPFIVPRIDTPVIYRDTPNGPDLQILRAIEGGAPWQIVTDPITGAQSVLRISGIPGAYRIDITGTATGDFYVPNFDTDELTKVSLVRLNDSLTIKLA